MSKTRLFGTLPPHKRDFYKNPNGNSRKHFGGGLDDDYEGFDNRKDDKDREPMIGD